MREGSGFVAHHETKKAFLKPIDKKKNFDNFVKNVNPFENPKVKHHQHKQKDGCENATIHKLKHNHDNYKPDIDYNALEAKNVVELMNPFHLRQNWASFTDHVDDCHSCQFNYKTCVLLVLSSQVDMGKLAMASSIAGFAGHFTPAVTGEDAATKVGLGVAASSTAMKILEKGFKIKNNPYVEIPLTIAGIAVANHLVNDKRHMDAFDWFFY